MLHLGTIPPRYHPAMRRLALVAALLAGAWIVVRLLGGEERSRAPVSALPVAEDGEAARDELLAAASLDDAAGEPETPSRESLAGSASDPLPRPAVAGATAGVIEGRVLRRADGAPVAGARVLASLRRGEDRETLETLSATDGAYRFEVAAPADLVSLGALATEESAASERIHPAARLSLGRVLSFDLRIGAGGIVSGTVVDAEGRGVAAAEVLVWSQMPSPRPGGTKPAELLTRSAFDGGFRVEHVGPKYWIEARAEGLVCTHGALGEVAEGESVEGVTVELAAPWSIAGHVVDASGRGIEGARVQAAAELYRERNYTSQVLLDTVTSDARGAFAISGLPPGIRCRLLAAHEAYLDANLSIAETDPAPMTIRLERGACRAGRVTDASGRPVAGARVLVWIPMGKRARATTGADGAFRLCGLPASDEAILGVHAAGHAILAEQPFSLDPSAPDAQIRLEPGLALAGSVVDEEGRAAADVQVLLVGERRLSFPDILFGEPTTWEWLLGIQRTLTDVQGRFAFEDLYPGTFELRVVRPEDPQAPWIVRARAGDSEVLVRLDPALRDDVTLRGAVLDGVTGAPLPAFQVVVQELGENGIVGMVRDGTDGAYRVRGLRPGRKALVVSAVGYARRQLPMREYEAGEHAEDVRLLAARDVVLRILDARGAPAPEGTDVLFRDLDGMTLDLVHATNVWGPWAEVGQEGRVEARGLPADVVRAVLVLEDGTELERDLDLRQPPEGPLVWQLERVLGE